MTHSSFSPLPPHGPMPADFGKKKAVLLVNLGTPDGTDFWSMRRYLKEFLSDHRVVDTNPVLWWCILNGIILNVRPQKSGKAYARIWDKTHNDSPLRVITLKQAAALAGRMKGVTVEWAMRYGNPSIESRLKALRETGHGQIWVVPLYPQYAGATVASVMDAVARTLLKMRWQPSINTLPPYYDHPAYIRALAAHTQRQMEDLGWKPDVLVASFHGLPVRYCREGDVYYCHAHKTARLLAEALGGVLCHGVEDVLAARKRKKLPVLLTFQSRFGKEEWLQPYTDAALEELARAGVRDVAVTCPGFAADCVETLEEIGVEAKHLFEAAGGRHFAALACLNDSPEGMEMLEALAKEALG